MLGGLSRTAALAGWMSPLVAAVIMPLSSLVCIGIVLSGFRISIPLRTKPQNS